MVKTYILDKAQNLPFVVESVVENDGGAKATIEDLLKWYNENPDFLAEKLRIHGAVLWRGFGINSSPLLEQLVRSMSGELMDYVDGNSPRTKVQSGVYTSTEYPSEYFISLHNELSYSEKWPKWQFFCCATAPQEGGETPLADSRALLQNLSSATVEAFREKKVKYIRNLHGGRGMGPSWQKTFETEDPAVISNYCQEHNMEHEWLSNGSLRVSHVRPATIIHPETGEEVWFNQADQFHPSTHPKAVYDSLLMLYQGKAENLPQNATFGDGTAIEESMLDEIRTVTREQMVLLPWQEGDLVMVDNMLMSHGRMPFKGPRKVLVAMSPF
ncbi:MAG: TauD/TfdA family dioxygenase [Chloroflexota bacterium]